MYTIQQHTFSPLVIQRSIWQAAQLLRLPIAIWRLPQREAVHLVVDLSGQPLETKIDLEELPSGFAFCPFPDKDEAKPLFLKAHLHYVFQGEQWEEADTFIPAELHRQFEAFKAAIHRFLENPVKIPAGSPTLTANDQETEEEEENRFKTAVRKAVQAIESGSFQKVVLSRQKKVALPHVVDLLQVYRRLCQHYPNGFVSLVSVPDKGTWMGASPEILISVDKHRIFRTVALAGTQPLQPDLSPASAAWTQKEIEEQALVCRYIINCFKKIRLREYEEEGPKTVVAGNLMHLRTDYKVDMEATGFPELGTIMLGLLHPTSAVCGMPKERALPFVLEDEGYNRAFYSGYLGPVNIAGESHMYVNLRCSQWLADHVVLYAGAGITADSVPEKEWRETELKCQTMYQVIHAKN